ncbi:MAG: SLC13/DASS family transporter [Phycisphaeraceae bacterium]|nr:SLC13/DASS family transporter [Phycisphaeraceae bacterium]
MRWAALAIGPLLAVFTYMLLPSAVYDDSGELVSGLPHAGRACAAVGVLMATWWLVEAIPLAATAMLPVVLFPLLNVRPIAAVTSNYGDEMIALFLGGFILGLAMERWGLHRRIALTVVLIVGSRPRRLVGGVMLATAVLSMFVSNTATCIMMLPIAVSLINLVKTQLGAEPGDPRVRNFALCLLLGVAYGASIGGIGTLIGTPPNTVFAGHVEKVHNITIGFAQWMAVGVPTTLVFLPIAWLILTRIIFPIRFDELPGGRELIRAERRALGPVSRGERLVLVVFICTAAAWIFRPLLVQLGHATGLTGLTMLRDAGIAVGAAVTVFLLPVDPRRRIFVMDWPTASRLPWGVILLFGGGLALADALKNTGVDLFVGSAFAALDNVPFWLVIAGTALIVVLMSEISSNTALAATLLPVLSGAAIQLGHGPGTLLVTAAVGASLAFMLPVGTPPNAMVYATGFIRIADMVKAGILLNIVGVVLACVAGMVLAPMVLPGELFLPPAAP